MKNYTLTIILTTISCTLFGQNTDTWNAFWNKDTTLIGFKNKEGIVKIQPKFMGLTSAKKFDGIIAVTEEVNKKWKSYYLTKTGKTVGRDSLHTFDNSPDCENEGFIRFRDHKKDKVGMFNKNGDVVIPAVYDDLTKVRNGMIVALKGAEKKYSDGGEHYSWVGGKQLLITPSNRILVDNFKADNDLNFFSLKVTPKPSLDAFRNSFKTIDGKYYSFIGFEIEFKNWLKNTLLKDLTKSNLLKITQKKITWESVNGWVTKPKNEFIEKNYNLLKSKLQELEQPKCDYFITSNGLNPFIFESKDFAMYYNNCGESKEWIYPTMSIIISYKTKKDTTQDHLEFLRTDDGYRLIGVTIREGNLK